MWSSRHWVIDYEGLGLDWRRVWGLGPRDPRWLVEEGERVVERWEENLVQGAAGRSWGRLRSKGSVKTWESPPMGRLMLTVGVWAQNQRSERQDVQGSYIPAFGGEHKSMQT